MSEKRTSCDETSSLSFQKKRSKYDDLSSDDDDSSDNDEYSNFLERKKQKLREEEQARVQANKQKLEAKDLTRVKEIHQEEFPFNNSSEVHAARTIQDVESEILILRQSKHKLNISDIPIEDLVENDFNLLDHINKQKELDKAKWEAISRKERELAETIASRERDDLVDIVYTNPVVGQVRRIQKNIDEFERIEQEARQWEEEQKNLNVNAKEDCLSSTEANTSYCFCIRNMFSAIEEPMHVMENGYRPLLWIREIVARKCNVAESSLILKHVPQPGIIKEVDWNKTAMELSCKELPENNEFWVDRDIQVNLLHIKFKAGNGKTVNLEIDKTVPFFSHCSRLISSLSLKKADRLIFDSEVVNMEHTAEQLELEDDDCIEVYDFD